MASTTAVYARIDADLKENAESILKQLGISPSCAIQMLYRQITLTGGIPFALRLPAKTPTAIGAMTRQELDAELAKGFGSLQTAVYSADEVDTLLAQRYGV